MPEERTSPDDTLQDFGPVRRHLTDRSEDHEQGWRTEPEPTAGGRVPELRRGREVPRTPIAQRFAERIKQAEASSREGTDS